MLYNDFYDVFVTGITPLVIDAKAVATNPSDRKAQRKLRESTRKVMWVCFLTGQLVIINLRFLNILKHF